MSDSRLLGIGVILAAWFMFALHDAAVKLLVTDLSAWEVLFARSLVVLAVSALLPRGRGARAAPPTASVRRLLMLNAIVYALAWIAYYSAARDLQLAELETVYYASPIIATVLAVVLLKEQVPASRWAALGLGFLGVILACGPAGLQSKAAVWLALLAALLWALSVVLMRRLSGSVSTVTQMLVNNAAFLVLSTALAPWWWQPPTRGETGLLLLVGVASVIAQYLLYEGIRRVPASLASPLEYSGLAWAFGLGFLIWGHVPGIAVFVGAGMVAMSGMVIVMAECQAVRRPAVAVTAAAQPGIGA